MLRAPLPSERPKTAQKLLQIARCISALKIALNCTKILLTRRFFACSFAFFRVVALLSVYVITNIRQEIEKAMLDAMQNKDPSVQEHWKAISPNGKIPTVEEVMQYLMKLMMDA